MVRGKNTVYALSGYVRSLGEADDSLNMLATQDGRAFTAFRLLVKDRLLTLCFFHCSPEKHLVVQQVDVLRWVLDTCPLEESL